MKSVLNSVGVILFFVFPGILFGQSLTLTDSSLVYEKAKQKILVKKLNYDTDFYGYDMVDDDHVFFVYKRQDSVEERAILAVFNLGDQKEKIIDEVRAARTTIFTYNRENGWVLFNGIDGIYILKIQGFLSGLSGPKRLIPGTDFFKVFWVDAGKFGYKVLDETTRQVETKYFTMP